MKLRGIYEISQRRKLARKQPVLTNDVGMTNCIYEVKDDQISHHDDPVVLARDEERHKHGGPKSCNVDKVLLEICEMVKSN